MQATYLAHALPFVLDEEGSAFTDNPNDSGGPTRYGITQADYNAHLAASGLPWLSVEFISQTQVQNIYRNEYWAPIQGDSLPFPIDWITFDCGVNCGVQTSVNMLEQALNLPEGYAVDPAVLSAAKAACSTLAGTHAVKEAELSERIARYHQIVADHAQDAEFLKGWLNRCADVEADT